MDVHTKQQRSYNMSRVKSKNTKPEIIMFSLLKQNGYSFKKHFKIFGRPDIVFPKAKVAVFVDGEFWHGRKFKKTSDEMSEFWRTKIARNISRDRRVDRFLRSNGWHVMRIWDKRILNFPGRSLLRLEKFLKKNCDVRSR